MDINICCLNAARREMGVPNAVKPLGVPDSYGWGVRPMTVMGARPYGSALPTWWPGPIIGEWRAATVWFVVYEAEGGAGTPCDVELSDMQLWIKRRSTGAWSLLQSGAPVWCGYYPVAGGPASKLPAPSVGTQTTKCRPTAQMFAHGGLGRVAIPWDAQGADLVELFGTVSHRAHGAGRYVVQCGIDYKPTTTAKKGEIGDAPWYPAAALGPFGLSHRYMTHAHVHAK